MKMEHEVRAEATDGSPRWRRGSAKSSPRATCSPTLRPRRGAATSPRRRRGATPAARRVLARRAARASRARGAGSPTPARPQAVAKRHALGLRTARENVADLCDEGSFVEYGALAFAAQRGRRELDDLIRNTPADGMVTGIGSIDAVDVRRGALARGRPGLRRDGARGDAGLSQPPEDGSPAGHRGGTPSAGRALRRRRRRPAGRRRHADRRRPARADLRQLRASERARAAGRASLPAAASPATPRCSAAAT